MGLRRGWALRAFICFWDGQGWRETCGIRGVGCGSWSTGNTTSVQSSLLQQQRGVLGMRLAQDIRESLGLVIDDYTRLREVRSMWPKSEVNVGVREGHGCRAPAVSRGIREPLGQKCEVLHIHKYAGTCPINLLIPWWTLPPTRGVVLLVERTIRVTGFSPTGSRRMGRMQPGGRAGFIDVAH